MKMVVPCSLLVDVSVREGGKYNYPLIAGLGLRNFVILN
jgi:hypothetical protein